MIKRWILILFCFAHQLTALGVEKQTLNFYLKFGFFKGGESKITISDSTFNGNPANYYSMWVGTTGLIENFFELNDYYESLVNPDNLLPYQSIRDVNQGNYHRHDEALFYHDVDSILSSRSGMRAVPDNLVDLMTVFFYFTNSGYLEKFDSGKVISMDVLNADEISKVTIQFKGFETIRTGMGKIDCYVITPKIEGGKEIMGSDGLTFYISKESKLPVLFEFDMRIGALKAILQSYNVNGVDIKKLR